MGLPLYDRPAAACSWEGCAETKDFDADYKCPPEWGLVEWLPPGTNVDVKRAMLCPKHFEFFFAGVRLKP